MGGGRGSFCRLDRMTNFLAQEDQEIWQDGQYSDQGMLALRFNDGKTGHYIPLEGKVLLEAQSCASVTIQFSGHQCSVPLIFIRTYDTIGEIDAVATTLKQVFSRISLQVHRRRTPGHSYHYGSRQGPMMLHVDPRPPYRIPRDQGAWPTFANPY